MEKLKTEENDSFSVEESIFDNVSYDTDTNRCPICGSYLISDKEGKSCSFIMCNYEQLNDTTN